MKVIYNKWIPFKGFKLINLWGLIFARDGTSPITETDKNHERIHTRQIIECTLVAAIMALVAVFCGASRWWIFTAIPTYYVTYLIAWILAGFRYRKNCFEAEAYDHQTDLNYLSRRKPFMWMAYVFK